MLANRDDLSYFLGNRDDTRAHIYALNGGEEPDLERLVDTLGDHYHGDMMIGHADIEIAHESEGWRVVSALSIPPNEGKPHDIRDEVIKLLRGAGFTLAHPG